MYITASRAMSNPRPSRYTRQGRRAAKRCHAAGATEDVDRHVIGAQRDALGVASRERRAA